MNLGSNQSFSSVQSGDNTQSLLAVTDISRIIKSGNEEIVVFISNLIPEVYEDTSIFHTLEVGDKLGFNIVLRTPEYLDLGSLAKRTSIVVVDRLSGFSNTQISLILAFLLERETKFVLIDRGQDIPFIAQMYNQAKRVFVTAPSLFDSRQSEIFNESYKKMNISCPLGHDVKFLQGRPFERKFESFECNKLEIGYGSAPSIFGSVKKVGFLEKSLYNKMVLDALIAGCEVYGDGAVFLDSYEMYGYDRNTLISLLQFATYQFWKELDELI